MNTTEEVTSAPIIKKATIIVDVTVYEDGNAAAYVLLPDNPEEIHGIGRGWGKWDVPETDANTFVLDFVPAALNAALDDVWPEGEFAAETFQADK